MRTKPLLIGVTIIIILGISGFLIYNRNADGGPVNGNGNNNGTTTENGGQNGTKNGTTTDNTQVRVTSPTSNSIVRSPLTVTGEARGSWYFEASFPIKMLDANGRLLGQSYVQAQGEWMTTNFVPFRGTITFTSPTTTTGTLVLEKDNPSGLPQYAAEVRIPVRFAVGTTTTREVKLYYVDADSNPSCNASDLEDVKRDIPITTTPIQDTIRLLLRGELTSAERSSGISTEFPLPGFELTGANLSGGVLTLGFKDPQNKTVGGSCRVSLLSAQIEETAKQFSGVNTVRLEPATLFQP